MLFKCGRIDGLTEYFLNFSRNIIFSSFIVLNIFLLGVTLTFFSKFFKWLYHTTDDMKSLYFSLSVVAILGNIGSFLADVVYTTDFIESGYPLNDFKTYIAVRYTLTTIIFILDIVTTAICIFNEMMDKKNENTERAKYKQGIKIAFYIISSCNILWSIHRCASALIVFALNIPVVPAASIGTLSLALLAIIGCVLVIFFFGKILNLIVIQAMVILVYQEVFQVLIILFHQEVLQVLIILQLVHQVMIILVHSPYAISSLPVQEVLCCL